MQCAFAMCNMYCGCRIGPHTNYSLNISPSYNLYFSLQLTGASLKASTNCTSGAPPRPGSQAPSRGRWKRKSPRDPA